MRYTAHEFVGARMLHNNAAVNNTTTNGSSVDTLNYREALIQVAIGTLPTSSPDTTWAAKLQESADNSTWSDVTGATFTTQTGEQSPAEGAKLLTASVKLEDRARYLRVPITTTTGSVTSTVIVALLEPLDPPATQTNTNEFRV